MRKFRNLVAIILSAIMLIAISGCSNNTPGNSTTPSEPTSSGTTTAVPAQTAEEQLSAIKNAKVGDTIAFNDYWIFTKPDGTKVYFADGAYAFVYNSLVVETRKSINVADSSASVREILDLDDDFKLKSDIDYYFYNSENTIVPYTADKPLTSEVTYCLAEYVDWTNEEKTQGYYYSYVFNYGDAPVKITSVYLADDKNTSSSTTESGESNTSSATDVTSSAESDITSSTESTSSSTAE